MARPKLKSVPIRTYSVNFLFLPLLRSPKRNTDLAAIKRPMAAHCCIKIKSSGKEVGYIYVGVAPSLKKTFDYVVLLNPDLSVKKSKILIYREDHGRQVGSQRWLKQFIGRKSGEKLVYGEDIDGISGATVSAKSMTLAVSNVLESLQILKNNNFF